MEYKKGSIVEVLVSDGLFYTSWRCAQIISGKGHIYKVSYDVYPGFTKNSDVERVSVKRIRPCPPLMEITECWAPGDAVEVFHNLIWKKAIVLKDLDRDEFLVRVTGVFQDFVANKAGVRVRQSYQNDEWIIIEKVTKEYGYIKGDIYKNHVSESHSVSDKTLKRASSCCYSQDEANEERSKKFRVSEEVESVGSCSSNRYKSYEDYHGSGPVEDNGSHESDAESVCGLGYHKEAKKSHNKEALADGNHTRELYQYRSTMEALYASGPLSWEKETMVTSLRMSLHISNDEHLLMLKCLMSANGSTLRR